MIPLMEEVLHQLVGSLSHYLQGFVHFRWCRISCINSRSLHFPTNAANFEPMEMNMIYTIYKSMSTHTSRFASCYTVYLNSVHVMIHRALHLLASAGGRSYALCSQSQTLTVPYAECDRCNNARAQAARKYVCI